MTNYQPQPTEPQYPPQHDAPVNRRDGLAVTALVLGILSVAFSWTALTAWFAIVLGILAIIFGAIGFRPTKGKWGLGLGVVGVAMSILAFAVFAHDVNRILNDNSTNTDLQGFAQTSVAPTTPTQAAPTQAPAKPKPKPAPKTVTKTVAPPPPAPQQYVETDPWVVINEYYGHVTRHEYRAAWNLLGPDFQANQGSYDQFVAGYRGTGTQYVFEIHQTGNEVTYYLESHNPDGTLQTYEGTATVYDGKMQHADVHQISGRPAA